MIIASDSVPVHNYVEADTREDSSLSTSSSFSWEASGNTDQIDVVLPSCYSSKTSYHVELKRKLCSFNEKYVGFHDHLGDAMSDAEAFVASLAPDMVWLPEISVADDGEINFFWNINGIYIDLGFHGTKSSYYIRDDLLGREYFSDDLDPQEGLPPEIESRLTTKLRIVSE